MILEWDQSLETGHEKIDNQHRELIQRINNLLVACTHGKGKDEVGNLLKFMGAYVRFHFSEEEALQKECNYPEFREHKAEHDEFISRLRDLEEMFFNSGATLTLVIQTNQSMMNWLRNHIGKTDKKVATFLQGFGH